MNQEDIIIGIIAFFSSIGILSTIFIIIWLIEPREKTYAEGQIDALNGKQLYKLIEFSDGTREYYKQSEIEEFKDKDYKIIK